MTFEQCLSTSPQALQSSPGQRPEGRGGWEAPLDHGRVSISRQRTDLERQEREWEKWGEATTEGGRGPLGSPNHQGHSGRLHPAGCLATRVANLNEGKL